MKINSRQLIELLGLSAIVASLIFVGFELKQSRIESENNRSLMRVELMAAIYSEVSENSDIWAKGNRGDTLSEEESVIYDQLIGLRWSLTNTLATTGKRMGIDYDQFPGIVGFATFLHSNPGARKRWKNLIDIQFRSEEILSSQGGAAVESVPVILEYLNVLDAELDGKKIEDLVQ